MKVIYGTVAGLITGFVTTVLVAPRSGRQARENIGRRLSKPVKNGRMLYNKLAYKVGIISEKKKAELNKGTIEAYNAKRNKFRNEHTPMDKGALKKAHERTVVEQMKSKGMNH